MAKKQTEFKSPTEQLEGVLNRTGSNNIGLGRAASLSVIETLDLISEGEIEGPVSGEYIFSGNLGETGWRTAIYSGFRASGLANLGWLRSVFWNNVPVISSDGLFNFSRVSASYSLGTPNGSIVDSTKPELTISRSLGERLRASTIDAITNLPTTSATDYVKYYRITNKDCKGVIVNVRIPQLSKTIFTSDTDYEKQKAIGNEAGDTVSTIVNYFIQYRPLFSTVGNIAVVYDKSNNQTMTVGNQTWSEAIRETVEGKINYGYIRSTRIDFDGGPISEKNFIGWEIRIVRVTPDATVSSIRNATYIDSLTEIYGSVLVYPNSAIIRSKFEAEFFNQIPERAFDIRLLKVKIPSTYNPTTRQYTEPGYGWDGTFQTAKQWTNNPVWCFYDMITNPRYGLGKYIDETAIDKFSLYEAAKYCDVLVDDNFGGLEPRMTCNLILNSREDAYKVLKDMASIFRGMIYYGAGGIYTSQDSPKKPLVTFTNANVENGNFNYSSTSKKERHTVALVRYNDPFNFYKPAIEYVEDINGIRRYGIRETDMSAFGCTSRGQAIRLGRWALFSENLLTETISCIGGIEASFLRPGDVYKVFDSNRKYKRYAGRTTKVEPIGITGTRIGLDDLISLDTTRGYVFSILTPGYYYEPGLISNLTSDDTSKIRKPQIQTADFTGYHAAIVNGKTELTIPNPLNYDDFTVLGGQVWTIDIPSGTPLLSGDPFEFINSATDLYTVYSVKEIEPHKFEVQGIQYSDQKFIEIESGLGFQRPRAIYGVRPLAPDKLDVQVGSLTSNHKIISYSFTVTNYSGITSYRVYGKRDNFNSPTSIPSDNHLIANIPFGLTKNTYLPSENGDYYFRVYSVNDDIGIWSTGYASGMVSVNGIDLIKDIIVSSLRLKTETGNYFLDSNSIPYVTTIDSQPAFSWQIGVKETANIPSDILFRLSIRKPTTTSTPDPLIYYQETGLDLIDSDFTYQFTFDKNKLITGGPMRDYDVVVEAMNLSGNTSAGNWLTGSVNENGWSSNREGYQILNVSNPPPTGIMLSNGPTPYSDYWQTKQYININGDVRVLFSGVFSGDIVGGFLYTSYQNFTSGETGSAWVRRNEFSFNSTQKEIFVGGALTGLATTGYIAVSFYDLFDDELKKTRDIATGLYVSNTVPANRYAIVDNLAVLGGIDIFDSNKNNAARIGINDGNVIVYDPGQDPGQPGAEVIVIGKAGKEGGGACFAYGTKITMADGTTKPIEYIQIGDSLLSMNIKGIINDIDSPQQYKSWSAEHLDFKLTTTKVTYLLHARYPCQYTINEDFTVTDEHEFLVRCRDFKWRFKPIREIIVGEHLYRQGIGMTRIKSIEAYFAPIKVVEIDVAPSDIYFAEGYANHNEGVIGRKYKE